ncbi:MAG: hypothetical protein ACE5FL_04545 [Myxococcota bacterium]
MRARLAVLLAVGAVGLACGKYGPPVRSAPARDDHRGGVTQPTPAAATADPAVTQGEEPSEPDDPTTTRGAPPEIPQ